ncbi:MAG TPA: hypothetical protein VM869_00505 [Enhygromyxa sp.]|jgi:hypothetical protein|nr:hypothetical protein [Enhygromyxa sp.]
MSAPRLRGQECFIKLVKDGKIGDELKAVIDFEWTDELEVQAEGYLGETSDRYDSIYKGTSFNASAHMQTAAELKLRRAIIDKAQRRDGSATRIDITYTASLPDGDQRLVIMVDVAFGNINTSSGGRAEYVTMKFEGSCSETLEPAL